MAKVLLAIDGIIPDKKAFSYAVALCQRMSAELQVLHIVRQQKPGGCLDMIRTTARKAKRYFEASMMPATFAEAGEFATADSLMAEALKNIHKLLPESEKAGVACELTMTSGDVRRELTNYVKEHREVVAAVYDPTGRKCLNMEKVMKKNGQRTVLGSLPIPVVMVES